MKTESTVMFVLRLALTLLLICAVTAGLLAAVNSVTAPIIEQLNVQKQIDAMAAVVPDAETAEQVEYTDPNGVVLEVYKTASAYAVKVAAPGGFSGAIEMMVGVSADGKVLGISVINHGETAGLGAIAADKTTKGEAFRGQFVGQSGSVSVTKDGVTIEAITGATISSRCVSNGVNAALECVANIG